jgi:hypothetical protein
MFGNFNEAYSKIRVKGIPLQVIKFGEAATKNLTLATHEHQAQPKHLNT